MGQRIRGGTSGHERQEHWVRRFVDLARRVHQDTAMRKHVSLGWLLAFGTAGCAVEDVEVDDGLPEAADGEDEEVEFRNVCTATPDPEWGCRHCGYQNSPVASGYPMDVILQQPDQWTTGPNHLIKIEDTQTPPVRHDVKIDGSELIAVTSGGDVTGGGLLGWRLIVKNGPVETKLLIDSFDYKYDWTGECEQIPTYGLMDWVPSGGPDGGSWKSVCPGLQGDNTTVVFTAGEIYDQTKKTVSGDGKLEHEVTLACRSHAVMKLKFMGYDPNDTYPLDGMLDRQAGFKMLTADFCGTGFSYTHVGQNLEWQDPYDYFWDAPLFSQAKEAEWTENGATCLSHPRDPQFDLRRVNNDCTLPLCQPDDTPTPSPGIFVSWDL